MKKYRPYRAGFIVIYVLGVLCIGDALVTLVKQMTGTINEYMSSFSLFSYLIALLAFFYVKIYIVSRVEIDDQSMRIVNPVYIKPQPGAKRASFIYRQGENDIKLLNKRFMLGELEKFGYIEDLGYSLLDRSNAGENNILFPVHEVALVMQDGKRYHWNAGFYSWKQLKEIVIQIQKASGVTATGKLAEVVDYTEESVRQMKEAAKAEKKAKGKSGKKKSK